MRKTLRKEALVTYIVNRFMDEDTFGWLVDDAARASEVGHKQAVNKLAELAISSGADCGQVAVLVNRISDKLTRVECCVGDELYFRGAIEGLKAMGQHITMEDVQKEIDRANKERQRQNLEYIKRTEAMTSEAAKLVAMLDEVSFRAVIATMSSMVQGKSNKAAFAAGNKILVACGRQPVPYSAVVAK